MMMDAYDAMLGGVILAAPQNVNACPVVPAPDIFVETRRQKTQIRHDLSKEQLMAMQGDTDLPYQMASVVHLETGGMMHGDIKVGYDIVMDEIPLAAADTVFDSCVRYRQVRVTLELDPTIFIARDFAPDSCWYHEIYQHEESHIDMDQIVIDKYAARIKDGLGLAFSMPQDNVSGPANKAAVPALKKDMGQTVMAMVDVVVRDMGRERQQKQQGVDSLHGYAYIMDQCYDGDNVIRVDP